MQSLPRFAEIRGCLPAPILAERPAWVAMYWTAWELAFRNFHLPARGTGFVSPFIDPAFNRNIYLWDTCFMSMFCNLAHPLVPGIASLDNFYVKQHVDGEICREIGRETGIEVQPWVNHEQRPLFSRIGWNRNPVHFWTLVNEPVAYRGRPVPVPPPRLTLDALDNPLPAWAEMESYRFTGDVGRIPRAYPVLVRYYRALQKYLRQGNGLYVTDWASMDDSPRNPLLTGGGTAVDTSSQMVLFARNLASMAAVLGRPDEAIGFSREADGLALTINRLMWDPGRRFYFDLMLDGKRTGVKTVAAYWTLLAGVASPSQAESLARELDNPRTFGRLHQVPTLAGDEPGFNPAGGYWSGSAWAPTTTMVIRGLENYGMEAKARAVALNDLEVTGVVYLKTGTLWENYAPDSPSQGRPAKPDLVGWTGICPILCLLEFEIGLKPDAPSNTLAWTLDNGHTGPFGCERYRFNGHVVSLVAVPTRGPGLPTITVDSDGAFHLRLLRGTERRDIEIKPGRRQVLAP